MIIHMLLIDGRPKYIRRDRYYSAAYWRVKYGYTLIAIVRYKSTANG
jgi:hypothetical protein